MAKRLLPGVLYERITAGAALAARRVVPAGRKPEHSGNGHFAPTGPQIRRDSRPKINPFVVLGGAVAAGITLARLVDWRSHAHPRR